MSAIFFQQIQIPEPAVNLAAGERVCTGNRNPDGVFVR